MKDPRAILFISVFVVMIGFGMTMPVLPFYTERITAGDNLSTQAIVFHIGLLTAIYAVMQLIFSPLWGRLSDGVGRRRVLVIGIAGYVLSQFLFGLANTLWLLYIARVTAGILSSATLPVASAYISDITDTNGRNRAMAHLGATISLGAVVGPALGGALTRKDLHFRWSWGHFTLDSFAVPFFAAALLGVVALAITLFHLPEPTLLNSKVRISSVAGLKGSLLLLLAVGLVSQFGLAVFEGTFAVFAQSMLGFGPMQVGAIFMVCGFVMTLVQAFAVSLFTRVIDERRQIAIGLLFMSVGLIFLAFSSGFVEVIGSVTVLSGGLSLVSPNLTTLISIAGPQGHAGSSLGAQSSVNSLGQAAGAFIGLALFTVEPISPFVATAIVLLIVSVSIFSLKPKQLIPG